MQKDMKKKNDSLVALLGAILCVCACLVGCERKEAAPSSPPAAEAKPAVTSVVSRAKDAANCGAGSFSLPQWRIIFLTCYT